MSANNGYEKSLGYNLVFHYDVNDLNSFGGPTTTNLIEDIGLGNYNNVPSYVRTDLIKTDKKFRGAYIWEQTLTALDGNGAYYLSNAQNPGIGVVTGGGGGTGGRYTGHSIFFKPTVPMSGCPIYTHYSNIGGWQSTCNYEYVGDGWYRAYVVWYDGTTRGDGKYWAINPLSTQVGQSIKIYWAGPFKEDLNLNGVSQYVQSSRTAVNNLKDLTTKNIIPNLNNASFNNSGKLVFDGSNDYITVNNPERFKMEKRNFTLEAIVKQNTTSGHCILESRGSNLAGYLWVLNHGTPGRMSLFYNNSASQSVHYQNGEFLANATGQYYHLVAQVDRTNQAIKFYINGARVGTDVKLQHGDSISPFDSDFYHIGYDRGGSPFNGEIPVFKHYDKLLNPTEIYKNYKKYKTRYSLASPGFGRTPDNYATSGIQIRQVNQSAVSGFYWINPQNALPKPIYVYVDFDYRAGEAWVLVQSNRKDTRSLIDSYVSLDGVKPAFMQPYANFENCLNNISYKGSYGSTDMNFNCLIPIKAWKYFSTDPQKQVAQFVSNSFRTISETPNHTKRYRWSFNTMASNYSFQGVTGVSDETGTGAPGLYGYHAANGFPFQTYDNNNGGQCGCSPNYGNAPLWYGCCWSGSVWGGAGGGSGHADAYFWDSSTTDYHEYGAVYLKS
jgi:hypothetical protein